MARIVHVLHIEWLNRQMQTKINFQHTPLRGIRIAAFAAAILLHFCGPLPRPRCKSGAAIGVVTKFRLLFHLFCGVKGTCGRGRWQCEIEGRDG